LKVLKNSDDYLDNEMSDLDNRKRAGEEEIQIDSVIQVIKINLT